MDSRFICHIDDVADGEARGFTLDDGAHTPPPDTQEHARTVEAKETRLIVVRLKQHFHVYKNSCPHTGVNLNWMPDQFFDVDRQYLQCAMHGALFRPHDGFCVRGPCAGQSLQACATEIVEQKLYLKTDKE